MTQTISDYIKKCDKCKANKTTVVMKPKMGGPKVPSESWQMIAVDFVGPFPRSKRGNIMLLVIVDIMTKFPLLFHCGTQKQNFSLKH